ncbi:ABC transporter permease [Bradyrhizobium sp. WSM3983]|uniref:ABC transporter permease n=1 Tax=Bradyrhizobium sp. WSM3983 TaxID=1038867 RepID=UPI000411810E|nr:ABC transporter permease [Bradyrhizobium sp. WSM3983]
MAKYLFRRVLASVPVLFVVAFIVFALLRLSPGDPAMILAGDGATPAQLDAMRHSMGLDRGIIEQFVIWLSKVLRGDFGVSLITGLPMRDLVLDRLGPSFALCLSTITLAVVVAIPVGVVAAWRQGRALDRIIMSGSVMAFSVPVFIIGYVLILLLSRGLGWFPVQGYRPLSEGIGAFALHLTLPTLTMSAPFIAVISRIVRSSVIEVMGEDYIRTARSKGLSERGVLFKHALGNAAVPIATVVGLSIALLLGGAVVTESVFNIPGLGRLVLEAVLSRDFTAIQTLILLSSVTYVVINLAIDVLYSILDPRIRY